jgi:hypothetical protein
MPQMLPFIDMRRPIPFPKVILDRPEEVEAAWHGLPPLVIGGFITHPLLPLLILIQLQILVRMKSVRVSLFTYGTFLFCGICFGFIWPELKIYTTTTAVTATTYPLIGILRISVFFTFLVVIQWILLQSVDYILIGITATVGSILIACSNIFSHFPFLSWLQFSIATQFIVRNFLKRNSVDDLKEH